MIGAVVVGKGIFLTGKVFFKVYSSVLVFGNGISFFFFCYYDSIFYNLNSSVKPEQSDLVVNGVIN